ncbi:hypothetical protein CH371_09720 [Leptospira wolffii]|uniref:Uncharacterized protein n=1 Tax=Leptospira wolffii TaxID=409998 RepID=A0A2M9ZBP4_9LEPT|nr:hypothetical protein CH371_09720 [Leptospira wolffii]
MNKYYRELFVNYYTERLSIFLKNFEKNSIDSSFSRFYPDIGFDRTVIFSFVESLEISCFL